MRQTAFALSLILACAAAAVAAPLLKFSGNSYVGLGIPGRLQLPDNHPLTVEGWVKFTTVSGTQMLYSKNAERSSPQTFMFGITDNGTMMSANTGHGGEPSATWRKVSISPTLQAGRWYHLAYSFDGTNIYFYLDGAFLGSAPFSFGNTPAHDAKIGGYANSTDIQGNVREVRVWNFGRSPSQTRATMHHRLTGREPELLGYWPLDEGAGYATGDRTLGGSHGTLFNATWEEGDRPPSEPLADALFIAADNGLFGMTDPPYGMTSALAHGAVIECDAPEGLQYDLNDGRYRAICIGYDFYTNSAAPPLHSGAGTSFSYTHNTNHPLSLLVWRWDVEYQATFTAGTGGSVSTAGGWVTPGDNIVATATPDSGKIFHHWSGDVPDGQRFNATIGFAVDRACDLTANFGDAIYVAPSGNDSNDGTSWATAKATIQSGINAAAVGGHVIVSNGTYGVTTQIALNKGVMVRSLEGPEVTVVERASGTTRIFNISDTQARLSGFKVTKGSTGQLAHGAAIAMSGGMVDNCLIAGNWGNRGSIVHMTGGLLSDSRIVDNYDNGDSGGSGGLYLQGGNAVARDCLLTRNKGGKTGGAVSAIRMEGACAIERLCISNNLGRGNAAAIDANTVAISGSGGRMRNCLVVNNTGRGVLLSGASAVENCTIAGNVVYGDSGNGLRMTAGSVVNSIICYNGTAPYAATANDVDRSGGTIDYSCAGVLPAGAGNTAAAPLFANPAIADYTLLPGSPCIDSGRNLPDVSYDLSKAPRPVDGDGDNDARHDMGCYEMAVRGSGDLRCGFTASRHEMVGSGTVEFTPFVAGDNVNLTFVGWSFGDNTTLAPHNLHPVWHSYDPGFYSVSLVVSNALGQGAAATMVNDIRFAGEAAYVALDGAHIAPFDTWAKAANNIMDAIGAVISTNGEVRSVIISNGEFQVSAELELNAPLWLKSANGPAVSTIKRTGSGHVVSLRHKDAIIDGVKISGGTGGHYEYGTALNISSGTATNCLINDNKSTRGSIVFLNGATALLVDSTISGNTEAGDSGGNGGIRMDNGAKMLRCLITGNKCGSESSGIMALWMTGAETLASHCVITNNKHYNATTPALCASIAGGSTLRNSLIADNQGRGINLSGASLVESCTIAGNNYSSDVGNGVSMAAGTLRNSIVWGNGIDNMRNLSQTGGDVAYCDINPSVAGTGNRSTDPVFVKPATGDYRLQPASPLIDAGDEAAWMVGAVDIDGAPRLVATTVDMGCYEAPDPDGGALTCNYESDFVEGFTDFAVTFNATARGLNREITFYGWDFGDGAKVSGMDKSEVLHVYQAPGLYTVTLVVSNTALEEALAMKQDYIYAVPEVIHITTNGLHVAPYASWQTAATNVHSAMEMARVIGDKSTLLLASNGTYRLSKPLIINDGVTMRSVNGWRATCLTRLAGNINILTMKYNNAVIDGFDLKGGIYPAQTAGGVIMSAGTVLNCAITDNQGYRHAGGLTMSGGVISNTLFSGNFDSRDYANAVGAAIITDGLVIDCDFIGNSGGNFSGAVGGIKVSGGMVQNARIMNNTYLHATGTAGGAVVSGSGILRNCLIAGNKGKGLVQSGGTVENCTIVRNDSDGINFSGGALVNTISHYNGGDNLSATSQNYSYLCVPEIDPAAGNGSHVSGTPRFRDDGDGYGVGWTAGDYRLRSSSPCISAGMNLPWMDNATDLDGAARRIGLRVDIGAYEVTTRPATIMILR